MSAAAVCQTPLNICVVAHQAYGALTETGGHIGGVERQTALLARWLAARGHRVSMITWDEGDASVAAHDGVAAIRLCREDAGWPGARFVHPRWTSLVTAMRAADAALYYHNCAEYVTGQVALWCRANARKFVYSAASNADCDARLPFLTKRRERILYRIGLRRADRIVVQTDTQKRLMRASFGLDAVTIPMPCTTSTATTPAELRGRTRRHRVVWIGRVCAVKRPELFLDLADRCPDLTFDLVGPDDGTARAREVMARAARTANVRVHGGLPHPDVLQLLDETLCLCCTSEVEGFPNTFVESWSRAVPTLSTFDPDGVIARHGLGMIASGIDELCARLRLVLDEGEWSRASENAHRYYRETHTIDATLPRFEAIFQNVVAEGMVAP